MESIALLCTDGSDSAIEALRASLPLLRPVDRTIVVTVESPVAQDTDTGNGFALGPSSDGSSDQIKTSGDRAAKQVLDRTVAALGIGDVELMAVVGTPGEAICELAASLPASVVIIGTSGHGGLRRAVMGSTSDHVIRHSVCPVMVQGVGRR